MADPDEPAWTGAVPPHPGPRPGDAAIPAGGGRPPRAANVGLAARRRVVEEERPGGGRPRARGARAGYDGSKRRKGSKVHIVHIAVDNLGHLLVLHVTPGSEQDRAQVATLREAMQRVTGELVELAFVDQS